MRFVLFVTIFSLASAFSPVLQTKKSTTTQLSAVSRRDAVTLAVGAFLAPQVARAASHGMANREGAHTHGSTFFFDENIEKVREESQMPTGGKVDLNNAAVVSEAKHAHDTLS